MRLLLVPLILILPLTGTTNEGRPPAPSANIYYDIPWWERLGYRILLPTVEFDEAPLSEVLTWLQKRTHDFDMEGEGMSIIVAPGGTEPSVTLKLKNCTPKDVLDALAEVYNITYAPRDNNIILIALPGSGIVYTQVQHYKPSPYVYEHLKKNPRKSFEEAGIIFPPGTGVGILGPHKIFLQHRPEVITKMLEILASTGPEAKMVGWPVRVTLVEVIDKAQVTAMLTDEGEHQEEKLLRELPANKKRTLAAYRLYTTTDKIAVAEGPVMLSLGEQTVRYQVRLEIQPGKVHPNLWPEIEIRWLMEPDGERDAPTFVLTSHHVFYYPVERQVLTLHGPQDASQMNPMFLTIDLHRKLGGRF